MLENGQNPPGNTPQETPENGQSTGVAPILEAAGKPVRSNPPQIKEKTVELYRRVVKLLTRYSTAKRSPDPLEPVMVSPTMLVEDLYARRGNSVGHPEFLEPTTFSTYRSALMWHLGDHRGDAAYDAAHERLVELSNAAGVQTKKRSPKKRRAISEADLHILTEELSARGHRSRWSYRALYWLLAGLASGLRPIEWSGARWEDETHSALIVDNAKIKLSAPTFLRKGETDEEGEEEEYTSTVPPTRRVPVLTEKDRFNIETHMNLLAGDLAEGAEFTNYYEQCRRAIWYSCRKLWESKKTYSLYTMRGQYSANQRAAVGSSKTSVLMGHSRPDTPSASYYGKANQAHAGFRELRGEAGQQQTETPLAAEVLSHLPQL